MTNIPKQAQNEMLSPSSLFTSLGLNPDLRQAGNILALQVVLELADLLTTLNPALTVSLTSLVSQLVQSRPVGCMVVAEFDITTHSLHELARWDVLTEVLIELELLSSIGVNQGCDQLEESPDDEGHYHRTLVICHKITRSMKSLTIDYQSPTKSLGVVVLQEAECLLGLAQTCVLARFCLFEVDN